MHDTHLLLVLHHWGGQKGSNECAGLGQVSAVGLYGSDSKSDN